MFRERNSYKAFTLVELLVVIAIISVLAAMLMPALEKAMDQAYRVTCMGNLKQFGLVSRNYGDEWRDFIPCGLGKDVPALKQADWCMTIAPYLDYEETPTGGWSRCPYEGVWHCPTNDNRTAASYNSVYTASYGMARALCLQDGYYTPTGTPVLQFSRQPHPQRYVLIAGTGFSVRTHIYFIPSLGSHTAANPWIAHDDGSNILWLDLHVEWMAGIRMEAHWPAWMAHGWNGCTSWCTNYYAE